MTSPSGPGTKENLLARESSPYLLQHRHNPVDWRPWSEEALEEARRLDKPILLSVGYAACHWCHVMAHESFEDEAIADLMNRHFVNIKVDREERPDLDQIYQQALAILGEQGGWPLTMFLTPEGRPFWGGTYFPPEGRWGRPGFSDVLTTISAIYANEKEKVAKNVAGLADAMGRLARSRPGGEISDDLLNGIAARLLDGVDFEHGGIAGAPKFPHGPIFHLFWRAWKRTRNRRCRDAVTVALSRMAEGGIYDHLGGGFARYSTDARWLVPHFEKMLYDNAELVSLMTLVWLETREPLLEARVRETIGWLEREMLAEADGAGRRAFAASLDADSEGEEGRFYVWSEIEIDRALGEEAEFFKRHYDVTAQGNWEGHVILNRSHRSVPLEAGQEARLASAREKLLQIRAGRVRPGWDDKVLADWNGLMIQALAQAGLAFGERRWVALANSAFDFVRANMVAEGRLLHSWRAGRARHMGTLDDHANTAAGALALLEASGREDCLAGAIDMVDILDAHFWDETAGGYFMTADDVRDLVQRPKSAADGATPNGNGTMVTILSRLHLLTGEARYLERAETLIRAFSGEAERNVFSLATLLNGADFMAHAVEIVIAGDPDRADTDELVKAALAGGDPNRMLITVPPGRLLAPIHPAFGKGPVDGMAAAYVCRRGACGLPVTHPSALGVALRLG